MDIAEEKQAQRTSGKAARRALSPEQRAAANAALCARLWQLDAVQNAQTILLYAAFGGEAGLAGFAAVAHAAVDEHDQRLDAFVTERGLYTWT